MGTRLATGSLALLLSVTAGCSRREQERARERADQAQRKVERGAARAREDARKLGNDARRQADALKQNIDNAVQPGATDASQSAEEKLRNGGQELRRAGRGAAGKIDRAALIAKVKTKLADQAGLNTLTGINVSANGTVVTLRGKVASPEEKQQAQAAAAQVPEVTKVVNDLTVEP